MVTTKSLKNQAIDIIKKHYHTYPNIDKNLTTTLEEHFSQKSPKPIMIHTEIIKKIQQKHKEKFGIKPSKNEIRLLNYCPTLQERPDFFKKHNIFNFPMNRKTSYWIKGTKSMNGYFDFTGNKTIQNNKPEKIELPRKDLDPIYNIGKSESTAISLSFYNGLFKKKKSKYYNLSPSAKLLLWDKQIIQKAFKEVEVIIPTVNNIKIEVVN